jgi:hypothetical protein
MRPVARMVLLLLLVVLTFFAPARQLRRTSLHRHPGLRMLRWETRSGSDCGISVVEGTCTGMGRRWLPTPARRFR